MFDLGTFHCYHFHPCVYCCQMVLFGLVSNLSVLSRPNHARGVLGQLAKSATSWPFLCRHANSFQPGSSVGCSSKSMDIQDPGKKCQRTGKCTYVYIVSHRIASHCHIVMVIWNCVPGDADMMDASQNIGCYT